MISIDHINGLIDKFYQCNAKLKEHKPKLQEKWKEKIFLFQSDKNVSHARDELYDQPLWKIHSTNSNWKMLW